MNEPKIIFTDGINKINVINGMARLTIGTIATGNENGEESFNDEYVLVMPINSFLAGMQSQDQVLRKLEEANIVKKAEPAKEDIPSSLIIP